MELKFRVWRNKTKSYCDDSFECGLLRNGKPTNSEKGLDLEFFTGLKDKNGVEIYKGDLISLFDPYNQVWSKDSAEVVFSHKYVGGWVIEKEGQSLNIGTRTKYIKVVGNIHEVSK